MEENIDADDGAAPVMAAAAAAPNPIKKKPGRPKKKPVAVPVEFLGIVGAPLAPDDVFEMSYNNPSMFKKILQIEKGYEPENLIIQKRYYDYFSKQIESSDLHGVKLQVQTLKKDPDYNKLYKFVLSNSWADFRKYVPTPVLNYFEAFKIKDQN